MGLKWEVTPSLPQEPHSFKCGSSQDVFPETYNKATNYDFAKKHSLSIYPENDELFKTISEFQEIKECFLKEYYRFNFFEKFDSSDRTDKLEKIKGTFSKREK